MTCSCSRQQAPFQLLSTKELNFPSASAIEFYGDKLYVFGDDAPYLLVLSPDYEVIDSVFFWAKLNSRIPKDVKHDIESAMIRMEEGQPVLYGIGSMSTAKRWGAWAYYLQADAFKDVTFFEPGKAFPSVQALNIEGSCVVGRTTVFCNRANLSAPLNHLIFLEEKSSAVVKPITLPHDKIVAGISGLFYVEEKDLLLFTASEEETASTTADGAIGESYLGWIENFSAKMQSNHFQPDKYIKLSEIDSAFVKQKIESVCVEKEESNSLRLHLTADNDNGTSRLFKLKMAL